MQGLAGLGLFLFGILLLEEGLRTVAGRSTKLMLRRFTDHPLSAILTGILATAILQSSSVVMLLLLALAGSGILALRNAIGVLIGANLGTTLTGWVVAVVGFKFDIEAWIYPLLALGSLTLVAGYGRRPRVENAGRIGLGVGLLFFGLTLLKHAMGGLGDQVDLLQFAKYGIVPFALAGALFTAVIQSSSAAMVITLTALHAGLIDLTSAAALVVGADLGTTATAALGSLGGTAIKKQVALAHIVFNAVTDAFALALLPVLLWGLVQVMGTGDPLMVLVAFHSSFNLLGIVLFLPILGPFSRFLERRVTAGDLGVPGLEMLQDLDARSPEAALLLLERATRAILKRGAEVNRLALGEKPAGATGVISFPVRYGQFKLAEGEVLTVAVRLGRHRLSEPEVARLNRLIGTIRNAGASVKDFRDVESNLRELEQSPDDRMHNTWRALRTRVLDWYGKLDVLLEQVPLGEEAQRPGAPEVFEQLWSLLDANRQAYEAAIAETYAHSPSLPADQVTDALNVHRESYTSTKRLILAAKEALLPADSAKAFDALPNR